MSENSQTVSLITTSIIAGFSCALSALILTGRIELAIASYLVAGTLTAFLIVLIEIVGAALSEAE